MAAQDAAVEQDAAAPADSHARREAADSNLVSVPRAWQALQGALQSVHRDAVPSVRELQQRDALGQAPTDARFQARQGEQFPSQVS